MKRFERSNGLDTALYKNYLYLLLQVHLVFLNYNYKYLPSIHMLTVSIKATVPTAVSKNRTVMELRKQAKTYITFKR